MNDHQLWPFKYINGEQTEASKALQNAPPEPKKSLYEAAVSDPTVEECLL